MEPGVGNLPWPEVITASAAAVAALGTIVLAAAAILAGIIASGQLNAFLHNERIKRTFRQIQAYVQPSGELVSPLSAFAILDGIPEDPRKAGISRPGPELTQYVQRVGAAYTILQNYLDESDDLLERNLVDGDYFMSRQYKVILETVTLLKRFATTMSLRYDAELISRIEARALDYELTVATPVRKSAPVEPLPMPSLSPASPMHNLWLWGLGLVIVATGAFAVTHTDKIAAWLHVPSGQQSRVNQKGPAVMRAAVQSFYNAINHRDFQHAYSLVSQSFRAFKPYDQFVEGYFATQSVSISTGMPTGDYVPTTINATDKAPSGTRSRTFEGGWHVIWSNGSYRLDRGAFRTVADTEPQPTPPGVEGATNETGLTLGSAGGESVAMIATPDTECAELKELVVLHDEFANGSIDEQTASQRLRSIPGYVEVKAGSSIERTGPETSITCAGAEGIPLDLVPVRVLEGPQAGTSGFAVPANIQTHNDALGRSSEARNAGLSTESATPQSEAQGASAGANIDCPEQQHIKDFILDHPPVPPPPPDTGLGYFAQRVSQLSVAQQQIVYQRSVAYNPLSVTADDIVKVLANHCRLADLESLAGRTKNPTAAWKTADYAPNVQNEKDVTSASADLVGGEMAAELAVEARGLVSDAVVERLYIAFEPVIPLSTIPMKFREGSVTALTR